MTVKTGYNVHISADGNRSEYLHSVEEYDDRNNLLSSLYYEEDGSISEKILNTYYDNSELKQTQIFQGNDSLLQTIRYFSSTENDCLIKTEITVYQDSSEDKFMQHYKENKITTSERYSNGSLCETEEYSYGGDKLLKYVKYDTDKNEMESTVYTYEDEKVLVEFFSNGEIERTVTFVYGNGRMIERFIDNGFFVAREVISYDDKGNETEIIKYEDSSVIGKVTYEYDGSKNLIRECRDYIPGHLQPAVKYVRTFEYDTDHRLISQQDDNSMIRFEYT